METGKISEKKKLDKKKILVTVGKFFAKGFFVGKWEIKFTWHF